LTDFEGNAISNHYFAAPVELNETRKYVFIRVREKNTGKSFYVHEVFIEDEIERAESLDIVLNKKRDRMQAVEPLMNQKDVKASDLYRSIINRTLSVNPSKVSPAIDPNGEPLIEDGFFVNSRSGTRMPAGADFFQNLTQNIFQDMHKNSNQRTSAEARHKIMEDIMADNFSVQNEAEGLSLGSAAMRVGIEERGNTIEQQPCPASTHGLLTHNTAGCKQSEE
jgi:hypothetical protein